jgi:hypothetical protein
VTAGAAQAERVPGVEDLQIGLLDCDDQVGRPLTRLPFGVDEAAGEQHVGVRDPATECPPAGHDDAAIHRPRLTLRRPDAGGDAPPAPEQLLARFGRQVRRQQAARDRDRHTPAG